MVEWKTIGDISINVFAGGTPSTKHEEYYDGDIPWIRSGEIDFNTITKAERNITQEGYDNSSAKLIRNGSVVMAMTGATVAKSAIVEFETSANQSVCAIETDESIANYKYVYFYLAKDYFKIKSSAQGALTSLNLAMIKQIEIPIPSLQEQERIVGILDTFTASIDNLKAQIEQRRKQYEHYRDNLLDLEGKEGVEMKIEEFCLLKAGKSVSADEISEDYNENYYPCIGGNGIRGYVPFYSHEGEYPIIGRQGALCGCVNWVTGKFYATEHAVVASGNNDINQRFLFYLFENADLNQYKTQGAQPGLSVAKLNEIKFRIPSLQEQERIVGILDTFEASIANLEAQLEQRQKQYEYYREKLLTFE